MADSLQKHYVLPESTFNEWQNKDAAYKRLSLLEKQMLRILYSSNIKSYTKWKLYLELGIRYGQLKRQLSGLRVNRPFAENDNIDADVSIKNITASTPVQKNGKSPKPKTPDEQQNTSASNRLNTSMVYSEDGFPINPEDFQTPAAQFGVIDSLANEIEADRVQQTPQLTNIAPREQLINNFINEYNATPKLNRRQILTNRTRLIKLFTEETDENGEKNFVESDIIIQPNLTRINDDYTTFINENNEQISVPTDSVAQDHLFQLSLLPDVDRRIRNVSIDSEPENVKEKSIKDYRFELQTKEHLTGTKYYVFDKEKNKKQEMSADFVDQFHNYCRTAKIPEDQYEEAFNDTMINIIKDAENEAVKEKEKQKGEKEKVIEDESILWTDDEDEENVQDPLNRTRWSKKKKKKTPPKQRTRSRSRASKGVNKSMGDPTQRTIDSMPNVRVLKNTPVTDFQEPGTSASFQIGKGMHKRIKWGKLYK